MFFDKNFNQWNNKKRILEQLKVNKFFRERDIWFVYMGENIGNEQCGGKHFLRPVIVMRVFANKTFFGIPLATKKRKDSVYFYSFVFHDKKQWALLSQLKLFDSKRVKNKIGKIDLVNFKIIIQKQGAIMLPGSLR